MSDLADSMIRGVCRVTVRRHLSDLVRDDIGTEDELADAFLAWLQHNQSVSMKEAARRFRLELLARMQGAPRPEIKTIGEPS